RIATVRWMKRWLLKQDEAINEADPVVASESELQCTQSGQVLSDFRGKSVFDLNAERERELRPERAANAKRSIGEFRAVVRMRLGLGDRRIPGVKPRVVATLAGPNCTIRKLIFDIEPGIAIPALDISRDQYDRLAAAIVKVGVDWNHDLTTTKALEE